MASVDVSKLSQQEVAELACTYASLILYDDGQDITGNYSNLFQEIELKNSLVHQELKSNHIGLEFSLKLLKDKIFLHFSTSEDQLGVQHQPLKLPKKLQKKLQRMTRKVKNLNPRRNKNQPNKKKMLAWEDSLIDRYLNSLRILCYL